MPQIYAFMCESPTIPCILTATPHLLPQRHNPIRTVMWRRRQWQLATMGTQRRWRRPPLCIPLHDASPQDAETDSAQTRYIRQTLNFIYAWLPNFHGNFVTLWLEKL